MARGQATEIYSCPGKMRPQRETESQKAAVGKEIDQMIIKNK